MPPWLQSAISPAASAAPRDLAQDLLQALTMGPVRLLGAVLVVVLAPILLVSWQHPALWASSSNIINTAWGSFFAVLVASYLLKQFSGFPGIREDFYILQALGLGYGAVLTVLILGRLDYSRLQLIESFALAIVWYYVAALLTASIRPPRLAIVPGGNSKRLTAITGPQWVFLTGPSLPPGRFDGVVADLHCDLDDGWQAFVAECALAGVPVYHFKQVTESLTGRVEIESLSENNLGSLAPNHAYSQFKWVLDWLLAVTLAVLLLPVLLVLALLIRLDSPGPALFRQLRMGFRGRPLLVYKFRTMQHNATASDGRESAITVADDCRVTRIGRLLRHSRLDELPQILNILRGEMSWIGPRPEALPLSEWYDNEIPFYRYRHIVRPGITGWAQVNQGHVADVDSVRAKLHYDFFYIRNFSPWLDLLILMRTVPIMLSGFGAK